MIAAIPQGGRPGTRRGVPHERGVGGFPLDNHYRSLNPAAPSPPRYHVTVEELERMIRHARLTHGGSCGSSHSSSGTSKNMRTSRHSHHSNHSHYSRPSRHASRRDGSHLGTRHDFQHSHHKGHGSRHRSRSRGISIPFAVQKFKRGDPVPIKM